MSLNWDGVERFVENGLITKKGELIELDTIIFGTGYDLVSGYQCLLAIAKRILSRLLVYL